MPSVPSAACWESTPRSAERRVLRFTLTSKSRGVGGNATPPPVQCGARVVPARARPVPFWRHGFERPPETSPRLFGGTRSAAGGVQLGAHGLVDDVRLQLGGEHGFLERDVLGLLAGRVEQGCFRRGHQLARLPHFDEAVLRARHGALDEQQVLLGPDLVDDEPGLGHALAAESAGHLHSLEDARGRGRGADRARLADVVRAVRGRAAMEAVPLDRSGEALAVRDAAHLHLLARLEHLDGDVLADDRLALSAQLEQVPIRALDVVLLQVPELGLRQLALGGLVVGDLDRVVAVRVSGLRPGRLDTAQPRSPSPA